ncbi:MAG: hypothetical protein Q8M08_10260 [Bacteroidales bacterium]|nr:hypothetical protein [Bacteroidales bacterium]
MKKVLLCFIGVIIFSDLFSQDTLTKNYWTDGTAFTIPKHRWEPGLFTLSRYGITNKLELSAHPLMVFLMPQVKIKAGWGEYSGFRLATEHGIFYPTQFMRLVSSKGTGGLISPEFTIPQMFAISNRFLVSYRPFKNVILTAHAGMTFAVKFGPLDKRTTIDLPILYTRLAVFYNEPASDAGLDFRGQFIPRLGWLFNVENFFIWGTAENYLLENKGVLAYTSKKETLRIEAGYKLCFGKYPAGPQWHLLPVIDLIFGIGH